MFEPILELFHVVSVSCWPLTSPRVSFIFFVLGLDSHWAGCTCWVMALKMHKNTRSFCDRPRRKLENSWQNPRRDGLRIYADTKSLFFTPAKRCKKRCVKFEARKKQSDFSAFPDFGSRHVWLWPCFWTSKSGLKATRMQLGVADCRLPPISTLHRGGRLQAPAGTAFNSTVRDTYRSHKPPGRSRDFNKVEPRIKYQGMALRNCARVWIKGCSLERSLWAIWRRKALSRKYLSHCKASCTCNRPKRNLINSC